MVKRKAKAKTATKAKAAKRTKRPLKAAAKRTKRPLLAMVSVPAKILKNMTEEQLIKKYRMLGIDGTFWTHATTSTTPEGLIVDDGNCLDIPL